MRIFPVGTCRIHEPLSALNESEVAFPNMGYFHSSSQVLDLVKLVNGDLNLDLEQRRYFFRKDQVKNNPFNAELWASDSTSALSKIIDQYKSSDCILLEICSLRSYDLNGIHVQGNPNFYHNADYKDVWKEGYYKVYAPHLNVFVCDDFECLASNLKKISDYFYSDNKLCVITGHLVDYNAPNKQRVDNNELLAQAIKSLGGRAVVYFDQAPLVEKYGFRTSANGGVDIHHLPWSAYPEFVSSIRDKFNQFVG